MPSKNRPGCKCCVQNCGGTGNVCATVAPSACTTSGYSGFDYSGVTVTLKDTATPPNTIGTATTNSSGVACISYPSAIPLAVSATGDCGSASADVTGDCATDDVTLSLPGISWTITWTNSDCGNTFAGATITVTGPGTSYTWTWPFGATAPFTMNLCGPVFGTYTLALNGDNSCGASGTCMGPYSQNITVGTCTGSQTIDVPSNQCSLSGGPVTGCNGAAVSGATVSITGASGTGSTTTDASGNWTISGLKGGCTYLLSIAASCYTTYTHSGTKACGNETFGGTPLSVPSGMHCTPCCTKPIGDLSASDSTGTHALTPNGSFTRWTSGCLVKPSQTVYCYSNGIGQSVTYTSSVAYQYVLTCNNDGTWSLERDVTGDGSTGHMEAGDCGGAGGLMEPLSDSAACPLPGYNPGGVSLIGEVVNHAAESCGPVSLSFSFTKAFPDTATIVESPTC